MATPSRTLSGRPCKVVAGDDDAVLYNRRRPAQPFERLNPPLGRLDFPVNIAVTEDV